MKLLLAAGLAWAIVAPPDSWTLAVGDPEPHVGVRWWYSEVGQPDTRAIVRVLLAGQVLNLGVAAELIGSGRTVCLHAQSCLPGYPELDCGAVVSLCSTFAADTSVLPPRVCTPP